MATGDLYRVVDVQTLLGQQVLNVYFYKCIAAGSAPSLPTTLFGLMYENILTDMFTVQSSQLTHNGGIITNEDNDDEFATVPTSDTGTISGDVMPPFVAWAIRLNRASRAVRNGQKRIGGVPESLVVDGVAASSILSTLTGIAVSMATILTDPVSGAAFEPRIVHRHTDAGPGGDPPETPRADYGITSGVFVGVSSQNSRKFGHGA
jgi:hypothetical protein